MSLNPISSSLGFTAQHLCLLPTPECQFMSFLPVISRAAHRLGEGEVLLWVFQRADWGWQGLHATLGPHTLLMSPGCHRAWCWQMTALSWWCVIYLSLCLQPAEPSWASINRGTLQFLRTHSPSDASIRQEFSWRRSDKKEILWLGKHLS